MTTHVFGGDLFDGLADEVVPRSYVTLSGDRFVQVSQAMTPPRADEDTHVIDATGLTVLPGLINAHSHLGSAALLDGDEMPAGVVAAWIFEHCRRSLALGITTSRETGAIDGGVIRAIELGIAAGPRILASGPAIIQTGGHGDFRPAFVGSPCTHHVGVPGLSVLTTVANGEDEVRAAARLAFKRGATFLKLMVSGGVTSLTDSLEDTQFTVNEVRAAVVEAEARQTYVTVHSHNNQGLRMALEAGARCIEHATGLDKETAVLLATAGAAIVPTLTVAQTYANNAAFLPPEVLSRIEGVGDGMRQAIRLGHEAGVLVGCGSDLIGPDQRDFGMEVPLVAEVVGSVLALKTATSRNAAVLRRGHDLGSVSVGKLADLIAVDGDPLADPWILNDPDRIVLVIKAGKIMKDVR
jgi:imidazolonepropionase-like amidohydrolase